MLNVTPLLILFLAGLGRSLYFFFEFKFNDLLLTGRGYFMIFLCCFCISFYAIGAFYSVRLLRDLRRAARAKQEEGLLKVESAYAAPSINS